MSGSRPAYSDVFAAERLQHFSSRFPSATVTRDWAYGGSTGAGVRVAVIDSGVDASHPAVGSVQGYVSISAEGDQFVYDTAPHEDAFGHGTACAGIIRSLAPDCEILSVKVLGPNLGGKGKVFLAGLRWAIEHGATVCNLSLGTTRRDFYAELHELSDLAYFRNIPLVTAANNMPVPSFPSNYASVISVAAHGEADPEVLYYNPEPPVEFGAPGINVRVPWLNGGWATLTGNSFAAPHVTGHVARLISKHPGLTVFQIKAVLCALAANATPEQANQPIVEGLQPASETAS